MRHFSYIYIIKSYNMNDAHFHLAVNHLPLIIPVVGLIVLLAGVAMRAEVVKRTAYFIFVLGAIATVPAFFSGEKAEEVVEHLPGADHHRIHEHEETAEVFGKLNYALGALSLLGVWVSIKRRKLSGIAALLIIALAIAVLFFARQTGTSGGEILHTEIRGDSPTKN